MSVRQADIAKAVGIDVSSVNKILNRRPGVVFKEETIKRVFEAAERMGWKASVNSKFLMSEELRAAKARIADLETEVKVLKRQLSALKKIYKSA